jgi:hypothetical protein
VRRDGESIFEPDDRALIDSKEVACLLTERAVPQVAREAMRQPEVAPEAGQPQRRRQIDDDEVRFGEVEHRIVILPDDGGGRCRPRRLWPRLRCRRSCRREIRDDAGRSEP